MIKTPLWNLKKQSVLSGTYVKYLPQVGRYGSSQIFIKQRTGKTLATWGYYEIQNRLPPQYIGRHVRIKFLGFNKTRKKRSAFHFKINVERVRKLKQRAATGRLERPARVSHKRERL